MTNDEKTDASASPAEEIMAGLRKEFLEETADALRDLVLGLDEARHGKKAGEEVINETRRMAILLKGQAANVGVRLITIISHRMEDYLANAETLSGRAIEGLQVFLDTLTDVIEGRIPIDADASGIVRNLPAKPSTFSVEEIEVRDVEVLLVMLHGAATHFVEREMQQCGYRVTNVASSFEALPMIVRTKPDMIVISAVLPELSGIDLAIAIATMPETRNIPVALITSFDRGHESLRLLPDSVPVIQKGPSFGDDLAEALNQAFLL